MTAELGKWLRRCLTSREITYAARYFNRTWEIGRNRSGGVKYSQELIRQAEGQLSLNIGNLVSACTTEADLSQKVQALSKSDKFAYRRQHSKPDPQFKFPKHSLEDAIVVLTMTGWTSISGVLQHKVEWCFLHAMFAFQQYVGLYWQGFWCTCHQAISDMAEGISQVC